MSVLLCAGADQRGSGSAADRSKGSTDKFGTTILTHLFCPHFGGKSSTEHHSASGFPPRSDEKIYANLADLILSVIPKELSGMCHEKAARGHLLRAELLMQRLAVYPARTAKVGDPRLRGHARPTEEDRTAASAEDL